MSDIELIQGDCLDVMRGMGDKSVDAIITDLPYGTTACSWDEIIPFEPMWKEVKRILKPRGVFVTTASQPFTSKLVMSNLEWFKYEWIWDKKIPSGMSYARFQPMRQHENIVVFSSGRNNYYPQLIKREQPIKSGGNSFSEVAPIASRNTGEKFKKIYTHKQPSTIISYQKIRRGSVHRTQKPVALYDYLIKTYTNEGDTVLDFAMGSGTTGVACKEINRKFIGIEIDPTYFTIAQERIRVAQMQPNIFEVTP